MPVLFDALCDRELSLGRLSLSPRMRGLMLTDFYRGWMIEITDAANDSLGICCSPTGQRFSDRTPYAHPLQAWQAASQLIDQSFACSALKAIVRDAYETKQLDFETWQRLHHSLDLPLQRYRLVTKSSS